MTIDGVERGRVEALLVAPGGGEPMRSVRSVRTDGLRGLVGDRYAVGTGHWSDHRWEPVTLVAGESLDAVSRQVGRPVDGAEARRNVVTRGVDLDALVGRTFRIGDVVLEGRRPCAPCRYLQELSGIPGLKEALAGCGGLRADLRSEGMLAVGDEIVALSTRHVVDTAEERP